MTWLPCPPAPPASLTFTRPSASRSGVPASSRSLITRMNARRPWLLRTGSSSVAFSAARNRSPAAGEPAKRRAHEQLEGDEARHRVAREAEHERVGTAGRSRRGPEGERLAGLDGNPPQVDPADRFDRGLHDVERPDRDPAGHDDRVDAFVERMPQPPEDVIEVVAGDPEIQRRAAGRGEQRAKSGTIRIGDAGLAERFAGRPDLVAGGQYGNHGAAMDGELRDAGPGGERDRRCAEAATRLEEGGPLLQVAATRADCAAGFDRFVDETSRR